MEKRSCCCSGGDGAMNINMETGAEAAENAAAADAGTDDAVCHCRHKHRTEKEEKDLYEAIRTLEPKLEADYKAARYEDELRSLAPLKAPVDAFFDKVMVNAEDEALRRNRLTLLNELHKAMNQVAKLSCLAS